MDYAPCWPWPERRERKNAKKREKARNSEKGAGDDSESAHSFICVCVCLTFLEITFSDPRILSLKCFPIFPISVNFVSHAENYLAEGYM